MQYLGGKSRIAKEIAAVVAPKGVWWEPFCGGLSVSVQLAKYGPGVVSDANPALIALYQAVRDGWQPPTSVSRDEYQAAKSLPDSDPRKAFIGFSASFSAKWFAGYAGEAKRQVYKKKGEEPKTMWTDKVLANALSVVRDVRIGIQHCSLQCLSFFDIDPQTSPTPECIYADPPYEGTTGYSAVGAFDHGRFWACCQEWTNRGVRVFVSEYRCSVAADVVWEKPLRVTTAGGSHDKQALERLFLVKAPSVARVA